MGLHLETFDVAQMIEEIVSTVQPAVAKNTNTLQVDVAKNAGEMRADLTKVRQILLNLLSNSCKFTDHGTISLNVDRRTIDHRDWLQFEVRDTGIGITRGTEGKPVPGVFPGRCFHRPEVWRNRPRPGHHSSLYSNDARNHYGRQRARPGLDVHGTAPRRSHTGERRTGTVTTARRPFRRRLNPFTRTGARFWS